jgi:anthranilate synthase component 1
MAGKGNLIPVYRELLADRETPVTAFKKLGMGPYSFLLESVEGGEKWARYTFLGFDPFLVIRAKGNKLTFLETGRKREIKAADDPLEEIRRVMDRFRPVRTEGLPRFFGGAVGYLSYDMVRFFERLPNLTKDDLHQDDLVFMVTGNLVIFDNVAQKMKVVVNSLVGNKNLKRVYANSLRRIDSIIKKLALPLPPENPRRNRMAPVRIQSNTPKEIFKKNVVRGKRYIREGDIFQVVLSQRLQCEIRSDPLDIYRALRTVNPSPYMYFLRLDRTFIVGSSPEILVRCEEGKVEVRPIAGTRPRGKNEEEDSRLIRDLLGDKKELAEHIMLVDLGRNDVGRVAKKGTVVVDELKTIEKYSHVMHIVSNVWGRLDKGKNCFDVLRASFPAGTVSGAPKIRAMEIIEELEPNKRGIYAGAVGYFSFSGNMDMAIAIRTLVIRGTTAFLGVGAGIVADSVPEREFVETMNKGKALIRAIELAENGLDGIP